MRQLFIIILRRLLLALICLCGFIRRIFNCQFRRNQQRIGELPTFITNKTEVTEKGWSNWNEQPSAGLTINTSTQIEEYRRQMQANLLAARSAKKKFSPQFGTNNNLNNGKAQNIECEPDLFDGIQPNFKAPKRLLIKPKQGEQQRNLFEMHDCDDSSIIDEVFYERPGELGQLVENNLNNDQESNWLSDEDNIGLETLNSVEKEQQRRERELKKQQRQMEHVQQLEQKRRLLEQKQVESSQSLNSKFSNFSR